MTAPTCAIEGCRRADRIRRGWCAKHYTRWRAHGDPQCVRLLMPAGPLLAHIDAQPWPLTRLGDRNRRAVQRARNTGHITEAVADRIAIEHLGLTLVEIYGSDYDEAAA